MRAVSLCSGYGGLDLAVEAVLGAVFVAHAEIEPAACRVLEARWPGVPNLGDLKRIDWTPWLGLVDLFTAGYPCQPFSHAGRRKGTDDPRHLWPAVHEAIRRVRPAIVVLENVAGHRTLGLDAVLGDLATDGYDATWTSLRAADVGAPHGRERLFILATDADDRADDGQWARAQSGARGSAADARGEAGRLRPGLRPGDPSGQWGGRPNDDCAPNAADADGERLPAGRHDSGQSEVSQHLHRGTPVATDTGGIGRDRRPGVERGGRDEAIRQQASDHAGDGTIAWGQYGPAIERWGRVLGRIAPRPTEPGPKGGQRLSPRFVEWMMGLPAGWVTAVPDVSRNEQLKMLGNGVVPQQAETALRHLSHVMREVAAG